MSDDRFVVEVEKRVVGLAVRVPGGFQFFASEPGYEDVELAVFPRARAMIARLSEIARSRRRDPLGPAAAAVRSRTSMGDGTRRD